MANMGTVNSSLPNLWNETPFQKLFEEPWEEVKKKLDKDGFYSCYISPVQVKDYVLQHLSFKEALKHYKKEFLEEPEQFSNAGARVILYAKEPDTIRTIEKYTTNENVAHMLSATHPKILVVGNWFVDGEGNGGECNYYNGSANSEDEPKYDLMSVLNGKYVGLYTDDRVKQSELPKGLNVSYFRYGGDESNYFTSTLEPTVWADFVGSFITKEKIEYPDEKFQCYDFDELGEDMAPRYFEEQITLSEYLSRYCKS